MSKSKVQVWQTSVCLMEMERQSKAIVLDRKQENKKNNKYFHVIKGKMMCMYAPVIVPYVHFDVELFSNI